MGNSLAHLTSIAALGPAEVRALLRDAAAVKRDPDAARGALARRVAAVLFDQQSLRTRLSFDVAMYELGGRAINVSLTELDLGRLRAGDLARELSGWVDVVVVRAREHEVIEEFARAAAVPVVNARSDLEHPCQALADLLTLYERKTLRGLVLAYIGEGNAVLNALLLAAARAGVCLRLCCPEDRPPQPAYLARARAEGAAVELVSDPLAAADGADAIYTDAWRGQHVALAQAGLRRHQVDRLVLARAKPDAVVMHPLPANRGREIATEVIDGPHSVVMDQAENRLHMEKAILRMLLAAV